MFSGSAAGDSSALVQDSTKYQDEDYTRKKNQMKATLKTHDRIVMLERKKKSKSPQKQRRCMGKDCCADCDKCKLKTKTAEENLLELREENIHLKTHQRELEEEVKVIATRLKRQINQLKKDKLIALGGKSHKKLDENLDELIEQNFNLQEEERKLMSMVKKLQKEKKKSIFVTQDQVKKLSHTMQSGRTPSPQKKPHSRTTGDFNGSHKFAVGNHGEFLLDLENMRANIEQSTRIIADLKVDIEASRKNFHGSIPSEDMKGQLRTKELQVAQQRAKLEDLADNLKVRQTIFQENEAYHSSLLEELKQVHTDHLRLQTESRAAEDASKQIEYMMKRIEESRLERDRLQTELAVLTKQPFFKRETDQNTFDRIGQLEKQVIDRDMQIKESKEAIVKADEKIRELNEETREVRTERDAFNEEIERLRMQMDPSTLSLGDIQKKLHELDPSMFRQVMKDLQYNGDEPDWAKLDFMERLKIGGNQQVDENDAASMKKEIEKLKMRRRDLAAELQKVQNLLKMQVDIDKEQAKIYQQEIDQIKSQIAGDTRRATELNFLINQRNQKLLAITRQLQTVKGGSVGLTSEALAKIDQEVAKLQRVHKDEDLLSEFSVVTDESEVTPQENVMDLVISRAQFDRQRLSQILGNTKEALLPSAIQTFVTVDFYNHDTRNGDLAEGFEPNYATQFSFKNQVDDFYLQYLEKNTLTIEFFLTRGQNAIKIGTAKVVLSKLMEKETSFQVQEIVHEGGPGGDSGYLIGKIFFKMRMRKSLEEALRWYTQKRALRQSRDPMTISAGQQAAPGQQKGRSKIFTIQVLKGFDLKRPVGSLGQGLNSREMQPFFHFQFFTFDYTSPVAAGGSTPHFDIKRQFEVELNDQLMDYIKTQVLKIDLIDESVDLANGASDYIGSVRIPLKALNVTSNLVEEITDAFPVRDANGVETGRLEVKVGCREYQGLSSDMIGGGGETYIMSKFTEREVIGRIAEKFAFSEMQSIDMIFDMLIEPGGMDLTRITKKRFRDYILDITDRIRQQDVDILLKTHPMLAGKDYIDLNDFRGIFEVPVQMARQKKTEDIAEREKSYMNAQRYLRQNAPGQNDPMQMTFTQNPGQFNVFDQSLNQRMLETPAFTSGKTQPKNGSLNDLFKDKVYAALKLLSSQTKGEPYANWEEYRSVMADFTRGASISEQEISAFWAKHSLNGEKLFFKEVLGQLYGQSNQVPFDNQQYQAYLRRSSDPQLIQIKEKLQDHLIKNDISLEHLFAFLDKDKSKSITIEELSRGLKSILSEAEIVKYFQTVDIDQSNTVTYEELTVSLKEVHVNYILHKLKLAITSGKLTAEKVFQSTDMNQDKAMDVVEFNEVVSSAFQTLQKHEVDILFSHFDKKGLGKITLAEFKHGLNERASLEPKMRFYLHDFITPLQFLVKRAGNLQVNDIFDLFVTKAGATMATPQTFQRVLRQYLNLDLTDDELSLLNNALIGFYGDSATSKGLSKAQFTDFMGKNFHIQTLDMDNVALATMTKERVRIALNARIRSSSDTFESLITPYMHENGSMTMRSLKVFLTVTAGRSGLSPYEIECLVNYLDRADKDGWITRSELDREIKP